MRHRLFLPLSLVAFIFFLSLVTITEAPEKEEHHTIYFDEETEEYSIVFLGDVMLGRYVATLIKQYGLSYPFEKITPFLTSSTHVIANLEGPIPDTYSQTPSNGYQFAFPKTATTTLFNANIKAVSLANNHTTDYGEEGYAQTIATLASASIETFGHSRYTRNTIWKKPLREIPVVVFGINMITPSWNEIASLNTTRTICKENKGSYVIAFIHWGNEYEKTHSKTQESFAHKVLDTCVHAIIGAHPHVVQDIGWYKEKPIFYSLGNAVFDQYFSKETERGLLVTMIFKKENIAFELNPISLEKSQAKLLDNEERKEALDILAKKSTTELADMIKEGFVTIPYPNDIKRE